MKHRYGKTGGYVRSDDDDLNDDELKRIRLYWNLAKFAVCVVVLAFLLYWAK